MCSGITYKIIPVVDKCFIIYKFCVKEDKKIERNRELYTRGDTHSNFVTSTSYIHIHTHTYIYIHIHTYTYIYIHIYTYIYTHLKNSLIIQEENTKKNHKRVVSLYVIKNHVN